MTQFYLAALLLGCVTPFSSHASDTKAANSLPQVLIIGDSISIGYTPHVVEALEGKATVVHNRGNAGPTIRGIAEIDGYLGDRKWDVIHFNWGLWDMYGWRYFEEDRSPEKYKERLETLVSTLKKTGAKLIWATTTPVCPESEKGTKRLSLENGVVSKATERQYLEAALAVMKRHNIQINDLHSFILPDLEKYSLGPDNVHYTDEGKKRLGIQVASVIEEVLKEAKPKEVSP